MTAMAMGKTMRTPISFMRTLVPVTSKCDDSHRPGHEVAAEESDDSHNRTDRQR